MLKTNVATKADGKITSRPPAENAWLDSLSFYVPTLPCVYVTVGASFFLLRLKPS